MTMTTDELKELFTKHEGEFLKNERIKEKLSNRADLHAFILLDKLCPSEKGCDIVAGAEHDEIYLDVDIRQLAKSTVTEEQVMDLIRCGVRLGEYGLCMFA